jgi:hypothetical protein
VAENKLEKPRESGRFRRGNRAISWGISETPGEIRSRSGVGAEISKETGGRSGEITTRSRARGKISRETRGHAEEIAGGSPETRHWAEEISAAASEILLRSRGWIIRRFWQREFSRAQELNGKYSMAVACQIHFAAWTFLF